MLQFRQRPWYLGCRYQVKHVHVVAAYNLSSVISLRSVTCDPFKPLQRPSSICPGEEEIQTTGKLELEEQSAAFSFLEGADFTVGLREGKLSLYLCYYFFLSALVTSQVISPQSNSTRDHHNLNTCPHVLSV